MSTEQQNVLYQFPLSHYCEKVRWALDHKKIDYQPRNLIPGLHNFTVKKLAPRTQLPILSIGEHHIQGSKQIIDHLDQHYPENNLTPQDPTENEQAILWEKTLDKEIGVHIRRASYYILLDHRKALIQRFTEGGSWQGKFFMNAAFPLLRAMIRKGYKINQKNYTESLAQIDQFIDKLNVHLEDKQYIIGNEFSRVDITAAALLSPLCSAEDPELPQAFNALREKYQTRLPWVMDIYQKHRAH